MSVSGVLMIKKKAKNTENMYKIIAKIVWLMDAESLCFKGGRVALLG